MKVICIEGRKLGDELILPGCGPSPTEGVVYEALQHFHYNHCYLIPELCSVTGYRKFRFIPVSEIDEMEIINETEKATA